MSAWCRVVGCVSLWAVFVCVSSVSEPINACVPLGVSVYLCCVCMSMHLHSSVFRQAFVSTWSCPLSLSLHAPYQYPFYLSINLCLSVSISASLYISPGLSSSARPPHSQPHSLPQPPSRLPCDGVRHGGAAGESWTRLLAVKCFQSRCARQAHHAAA